MQSALSVVDGSSLGVGSVTIGPDAVLPVDFAYSPSTAAQFAVLAAGNGAHAGLGQVAIMVPSQIVVPSHAARTWAADPTAASAAAVAVPASPEPSVNGEPTALAFDGNGIRCGCRRASRRRCSGSRPPTFALDQTVTLSTDSRADTAWAVFHSNSGASIACASCHPEGGEDARVWQFDDIGPRRTQTLRGHVGGTEPFHWGGDLPDFGSLVGEVYMQRMAGPHARRPIRRRRCSTGSTRSRRCRSRRRPTPRRSRAARRCSRTPRTPPARAATADRS